MISAVLFALLAGPALVRGQMHHHGGDTLGVVKFPISCGKASQAEFNRAMTLFHHMTYPQARAMFLRITERDSACAMAYWGMAMTLFQPLWPTRPGPRDLQRGWEAMEKANSLNAPTERERVLIAAVTAFYRDPKSVDYWKRIHAWADGMEKAHAAFPDDREISALYALALLATAPPDQVSSPNNDRAAGMLLRILKENPGHPGAMHYLIHANDVPGREHESLEVLRAYEAIAPHNPHALHMPTHIYTRLGNWGEVIRGNIKAAEAALEFPAGDQGQYIWDEFPHAIEYLVYAYLQMGADDSAAGQMMRLQGTAGIEPTFKTAFHYSSTKARYALERKEWAEASAIVPREQGSVDWDRFPWPEAISWYARGLGSVHQEKPAEAHASLDRLVELESRTVNANEVLFSRHIRVLRLGLAAWLNDLERRPDSGIVLMTQAAELEASTPKHPVTPAGTIPAHELLGDLLFSQEKYPEATKAYERSLELNPHRFNSLWGAARASRAAERLQSAAGFYRRLLDIADPHSRREAVQEARVFLAGKTGGSAGQEKNNGRIQ
jgi:tetratricopeptide (TPR) repeat protein